MSSTSNNDKANDEMDKPDYCKKGLMSVTTRTDNNDSNEATYDKQLTHRTKLVSTDIDSARNPIAAVDSIANKQDNDSSKEKSNVTVVSEDEDNGVDYDNHDDDNEDEQQQGVIEDNRIRQQNEAVIYLQTDAERWEMTWPIWHLLPRQERKDIAIKYGYKTIGEFEEHMSFQEASHQMDSSTVSNDKYSSVLATSTTTVPYPNELLYNQAHLQKSITKNTSELMSESTNKNKKQPNDTKEQVVKPKLVKQHSSDSIDTEDDDDAQRIECDEVTASLDGEIVNGALVPTQEYLWKIGGLALLLPEDVYYRIFEFVSVETYAVLALVTPHWKHVTLTERVYKRLCERIYLNQSARATLRVSNFNNSYRTMLEIRPRVRVGGSGGGGVYVLKYSQIKRIQRDMWCEIPHGAILESVYYRYLYFLEDGRVLYSLTSAPPHEVFPRLRRICINSSSSIMKQQALAAQTENVSLTNPRSTGGNHSRANKHQLNGRHSHSSNNNHNNHSTSGADSSGGHLSIAGGSNSIDSTIVWGTYSVQKYVVTVKAKQSWQHVQFILQIRPEYNSLHGRFGYLSLERHFSSRSGLWDHERHEYAVPTEPFRFIRDRRM